jgi:hypothetical protein
MNSVYVYTHDQRYKPLLLKLLSNPVRELAFCFRWSSKQLQNVEIEHDRTWDIISIYMYCTEQIR